MDRASADGFIINGLAEELGGYHRPPYPTDRVFYVAAHASASAARHPRVASVAQGQKPAGAKACVSSFSSRLSIGGGFETGRDAFGGSDALTRAALGITAGSRANA